MVTGYNENKIHLHMIYKDYLTIFIVYIFDKPCGVSSHGSNFLM